MTNTFNDANQLTGDGTDTFDYDDNGNLWKTNSVVSHTWDKANRLLSHGTHSYAYDGNSARIQKTVSSVVTDYLLDVQRGLTQVLRESDGTNTNHYIHSPRGIHAMNDGTNWSYMLQDGLGSVRAEIAQNVAVNGSQSYAPYGEVFGASGTMSSPFAFTGEPLDGNGLQYHRARYYAPAMGVWASLDPLETANRYGYVGGNPTSLVDPSGLVKEGIYLANDLNSGCSSYNPSFDLTNLSYNRQYPSQSVRVQNRPNDYAVMLSGRFSGENVPRSEVCNSSSMLDLVHNVMGLDYLDLYNIRGLARVKSVCLLEDQITDLEKLARLSDYVASILQGNKDEYMQVMAEVILGVSPGRHQPIAIPLLATRDTCGGWGRDPKDCDANLDISSRTVRYWLQDTGFHSDYRDYHNQPFHFWASVAAIGEYESPEELITTSIITWVGFQLLHEGIQGVNVFNSDWGFETPAYDPGSSWEDYALTQMGIRLGQRIANGAVPPLDAGDWMRSNLSKPYPYRNTPVSWFLLHNLSQNPYQRWYKFDCSDPTVCYPGDLPPEYLGF